METYPLAANTFGLEEIEAAKAVLDSGRLTMGEQVQAFEREFAEWTGIRHALMVNSGSSANLLMVDALLRRSSGPGPLKAGSEVLVSGLSWPTTVWPLAQLGLRPVFVDTNPDTLALDLASAKKALSNKTKALLLVPVLGRVPNMSEYQAFCAEHGLTLIEDCCESLGGYSAKQHTGSFGMMGTFSFYFSHHISTIEGGMVVTNDSELYDDLRSLRAHGWLRDRSDKQLWRDRYPDFDERFLFVMGGYNVRPTDIQGATGRVQLGRLSGMLEAREKLAKRVQGWVQRSAGWLRLIGAECLPAEGQRRSRQEREHSWMTLPFFVSNDAPLNKREICALLEEAGIETRPIIAGNLARHPASARFNVRVVDDMARCDALLDQGFMVGCHPAASAAALETLERGFDQLARL
jgi:CDP-4-dehydro-6-deoxyglucose reductase, E1